MCSQIPTNSIDVRLFKGPVNLRIENCMYTSTQSHSVTAAGNQPNGTLHEVS